MHFTLSCMEITLTRVDKAYDTKRSSFGIKHKFTKYLKDICELGSDELFFFKYFSEECSSQITFSK